MRAWLEEAVASFTLTEEAEGYLLGRGILEPRIQDIGIGVWDPDRLLESATDEVFRDPKKGHGPRGERLRGRLVVPLWGPTGKLLGVEVRAWSGEKRVTQYLLAEASWNPVFVGLTPAVMAKIWAGGDVWIVEGLFDLGAMEHVVPTRDAVLGTLRARVSEHHATFLQRFCRGRVYLVYDNDSTGRQQTHGYEDPATHRHRWGALDVLSRVGVHAQDVPYRGGKDPGEVWDRGGVDGLRRAFPHITQIEERV